MVAIHFLFIISILTYCNATTRITCSERSPSPTPSPTIAISAAECPPDNIMDVAILNDVSCPISIQQCESQQKQISLALRAIKGPEDAAYGAQPNSRVAYIEFGNNNTNTIVSFNHIEYNTLPINQSNIDSFSNTIINSATCNNSPQRLLSYPNLNKAINEAMDEFASIGSDNDQRDKKIIIFSNCKANNLEDICQNYEDEILTGAHRHGVNIYMVNNGENFMLDDQYIACLVEYDENRIFNNPENDMNIYYNNILLSLQEGVCSFPTPTPTTDPTNNPTSEPTPSPTPIPTAIKTTKPTPKPTSIPTTTNPTAKSVYTERARRRLIPKTSTTTTATETSSEDKTPCIILEVKLETENLLPLNINPDPASNIAIIAVAVANKTDGIVSFPESPDFEEDENIDPQLKWEMDQECMINNQMNETYWPKDEWIPSVNLTIKKSDKCFTVTIDFKTLDSIAYVFNIDELKLNISHDCDGGLMISGAIYKDGELVDNTENVTVYADDPMTQTFKFDSTVSLKPNSSYQIKFELVNGYPAGCSSDHISFGTETEQTRRRLLQNDEPIRSTVFEATSTPNSCQLAVEAAISDTMRTGAETMCSPNLGDIRPTLQESIFAQHSSQSAISNFGFSFGSLHLYDINGREVHNITDFPAENIKKPCVAIDEENRRIYAIGGYDETTGLAVEYIQVYQFNDDTYTTGQIIADISSGWRLDKPRYGSTCLYYKDDNNIEKLVVISGMADSRSEFADKSQFYRDIRVFEINDLIDAALTNQIPFSYPDGYNVIRLLKNTIDQKPLLVGNQWLWFFGGKTHAASKQFVQRFDLNLIRTGTGTSLQTIELTKAKALPLTDLVRVNFAAVGEPDNIQNCYMIFAGLAYNFSKPVNDSLRFDSLQLFCNEEIEPQEINVEDRRRLSEINDNIPRLTEYDRRMLEKGKRRRLMADEEEETEIMIRNYHYGLDGMWYNFSVQFEICYNNNSQLREAEMYYQNIINSKVNDGDDWKEYKKDIDEKTLNYSLDGYSEWSDGFGAVDVYDLDIIDINYEVTPSPTKPCPTKSVTPSPTKEREMTHPERRKARSWWNNYEDRTSESYTWIDGKVKDCDDTNNEEEE